MRLAAETAVLDRAALPCPLFPRSRPSNITDPGWGLELARYRRFNSIAVWYFEFEALGS